MGVLDTIIIDRESSFTSNDFRQIEKDFGDTIQFCGIKSRKAIGQVERNNYLLHRNFNITSEEQPRLPYPQISRRILKAINDTPRSDSLSPSILLLAFLPSYPFSPTNSLIQTERFNALKHHNPISNALALKNESKRP